MECAEYYISSIVHAHCNKGFYPWGEKNGNTTDITTSSVWGKWGDAKPKTEL